MKLFRDGATIVTDPSASPMNGWTRDDGIAPSANEITYKYVALGRSALTADSFFDGALRDVRLWDRALSPAEIKHLYDAGMGTSSSGSDTEEQTTTEQTTTTATMFNSSGHVGFHDSPNAKHNHTIFELRFPASPGAFHVQLKDPGPTSGCELTTDPNNYTGVVREGDDGWHGPDIVTECDESDEDCAFFDPDVLDPRSVFFSECLSSNRAYVIDGQVDEQWGCISPVTGRYTKLYVDYIKDATSPKGGFLYLLNDWIKNEDGPVPADCYNLFRMSTGGGSERWEIKSFGDKSVWVALNDEVVQERSNSSGAGLATGAVGFGPSPNSDLDHTIFELKFPASKGLFQLQLHDPTRNVPSITAAGGVGVEGRAD